MYLQYHSPPIPHILIVPIANSGIGSFNSHILLLAVIADGGRIHVYCTANTSGRHYWVGHAIQHSIMGESRPASTLSSIDIVMPPTRSCEAARDAAIGRTGENRCQRLMKSRRPRSGSLVGCGGGSGRGGGSQGPPLPSKGLVGSLGRFRFPPIRDSSKPSLGGLGDATTRLLSFNLSIRCAVVVLAGFLTAQRLAAGTTPPRGRG